MNLDLAGILRCRLAIQIGLNDEGNQFKLEDALLRSVWIYGEYGLISRTGGNTRSPLKRLSDGYTFKLPVNRAYRTFHIDMINFLHHGYQTSGQDQILLDTVTANGMDRQELADELNMSVRDLNYRIRKEQNNWQLVKQDNTVYHLSDLITKSTTTEELIIEILSRYPFCSIDQLEFFTGLHRMDLARPITRLTRQEKIIRGLTRVDAPDELFALPDQEPLDEYEEFPPCVFEKRDALVELIKLERYFDHQDADYWIFVNGIPQAEFDLDKQTRSVYQVKNLNRFVTTSMELREILDEIKLWGKTQQLEVVVDQIDDELTATLKQLTKNLIKRGYFLENDRLILDRYATSSRKEQSVLDEYDRDEKTKSGPPEILTWHLLGQWAKNRQLMEYSGTAAEVVHALGQIDDIASIAYRLSRNPDRLWLEDVVYIPGINFRMGFVHKDDIEDIIRGWPKQVKFSFIDKKIVGLVEKPKMTDEILDAVGESPMTVKQRLRYLEKSRVIRKQLPGSLHMDSCVWIKFDHDLPNYSKPVGGKRAMASVGTFLIRALETNPPLTKDQLSRYLGLTINELEPLLNQYVKTNKIIEGYFMENLGEIQYTLAEVLDTIPSTIVEIDSSASHRVDILPISDPYSVFHLLPLVLNDSSIQQTRRYDDMAEQWMITWDGQPVGYFVREPTMEALIDFNLELKISEKMVTTPLIAGTLQKIVTIFRTWYNDTYKLTSINGIEASDTEWKDIRFLLESIGIEFD